MIGLWAPPTSRERIIAWANAPAADLDGRGERVRNGRI
jgi:hypothetical protein